jgi:hypothetical protein
MSIAAAQASTFYEEVVREQTVFTFTEDGSFLVFRVDGKEVVPFWSSRSRLDRIQREHPKYRGYACEEIALKEFLATTLVDLAAEGVAVGVNWSGSRLTGYDVSVDDLRRNIGHWEEKRAGNWIR